MRFDSRQALIVVLIAGVTGAFLFLPAVFFVGDMLAPSYPVPATTHVPALLGDAIWARANGGRATELQPLNPFTIGRTVSCNVLAERIEDQAERAAQHDECMRLLPAAEAVGYLASVHMRSQGVWQDPRVPFVQIATMARVTSTWTKAQLLDTLAARGEFTSGFRGVDEAARGLFNRSAADLTVPQAALLAALLGNTRLDPWCDLTTAANLRRRILERMRDNLAIDDAAVQSANIAELGLAAPPRNHKPCAE